MKNENMERKKYGPIAIQLPINLRGLILTENPKIGKGSLVIDENLMDRILQVIHEYRQQEKLKSYGLSHRRKIMLIGPPGTGKTMTAQILAHELRLTLNTVQVDRLVTKFMGETNAKLRQIFDLMQEKKAVYFFDEFDSIGGDRSRNDDVGEMRRVLNAFLQFMEQDTSDSIIIAATNNPKLLDNALFRRFDDVLYYENPDENERKKLILNVLGTFLSNNFQWNEVLEKSKNLSHGEIDIVCRDAIKKAILTDKLKVTFESLLNEINNRQKTQKKINSKNLSQEITDAINDNFWKLI